MEEELLAELGLELGDELTYTIGGESVTLEITNVRRVQWDSFRPNFFMVANAGVLDQFAAAGVTRSILLLPPEPRDKVLPLLDQYAKLIK
jgi:putative ABC transport system permease protein